MQALSHAFNLIGLGMVISAAIIAVVVFVAWLCFRNYDWERGG